MGQVYLVSFKDFYYFASEDKAGSEEKTSLLRLLVDNPQCKRGSGRSARIYPLPTCKTCGCKIFAEGLCRKAGGFYCEKCCA